MDFSGYSDFTGRLFLFSVWLNNNEYALGPGETLGVFGALWVGTTPQPSPFVYFDGPMIYTDFNNPTYFNVPIGDGFTNLVPIPGTVLLLGSGLIGIVGIRRKYNNKEA